VPGLFPDRSLGDELRSIFGDIPSPLSSRVRNEGKTPDSFCNNNHQCSISDATNCPLRFHNFLCGVFTNLFYCSPTVDVVYKLQTLHNRQEKSAKQRNITGDEKDDVIFEKHIELLARSRVCCRAFHSCLRLRRDKNNLENGIKCFERFRTNSALG
jgi:hypothetical protein